MRLNAVRRLISFTTLIWTLSWCGPLLSSKASAQTSNGAIQYNNRPFYRVFCKGSQQLILDFHEKKPTEQTQVASRKLPCKQLEALDEQYTLMYVADAKAKPEKVGGIEYVEVEYKNGNQIKKAWIPTKNLVRHESLCDYANDKLFGRKLPESLKEFYTNFKKDIAEQAAAKKAELQGQQRKEQLQQQENLAKENLEKYFSSSPWHCDGGRNVGFNQAPILKPAESTEPSKSSVQSKKCFYDQTENFKKTNSGQMIAQKMKSLPRGSKESEDQFIQFFGAVALKLEQQHGIPAELFLTKLIFETGNGRDDIIGSNNNIGGIGYNYGRGVSGEMTTLDGEKRFIKTGYALSHFKFYTVQDSIDYYLYMMLYQPETFGAYSGFRQTICSTINKKLDDPKVMPSEAIKAISPYVAADGLINYSELRGGYVQTLKNTMAGTHMIKNFKKDYMLCAPPGERKEFEQPTQPVYTSQEPDNSRGT